MRHKIEILLRDVTIIFLIFACLFVYYRYQQACADARQWQYLYYSGGRGDGL